MSKRGGFQIIDLKSNVFASGVEATIPGIYATIEGNLYKTLILSGLVLSTTEYADTPVEVTISGTSFVMSAYGNSIVVAEDDGVTVTAMGFTEISPQAKGTKPTCTSVAEAQTAIQGIWDKLVAAGVLK